jgi:poly-gamma-glutamate synthesis protein (capsule biosynthesis protein)
LLLTGDVMLGRGVDQILPRSVSPRLYEGYVKDARDYVDLAIEANGPLPPRPQRGSAYPCGGLRLRTRKP